MHIRIITNYDIEVDECVERVNEFTIDIGFGDGETFMCGQSYGGGKIIECFVHPESDCAWFILNVGGGLFEISFDSYISSNV